MLTPLADGVLIHTSEFMQSNAVVLVGGDGVLLVDPGVTRDEIACLTGDVRDLDRSVVAGFSTHPHWDHLLWDESLGSVPRYGTARCAETARERLSDPGARARVATMMPPDLVDQVSLDGLGAIAGLPTGAGEISWDGPRVRVIEHQAHAPGHAALLIEGSRVLLAGDLVSDLLFPILDRSAEDAVDDYLAALALLEDVAGDVDVVVPGHGSVCGTDGLRARIEQDRVYVRGLRDGTHDPQAGPLRPTPRS